MVFLGVYTALCKGLSINIIMEERPLCPTCFERPVAVNYVKEDRVHYRKVCDSCARKGKKLKPKPPQWVQKGYKKKPQCEHCGFKFKLVEQSLVYHVDGNLSNTDYNNLKTICRNCVVEISKSRLPWKPAKGSPGF
jgi:5-methylcytosine-specific restriction endonuclease McrA